MAVEWKKVAYQESVDNRSRSATLVVAASDAAAAGIDAADYACSGADDEVQINAALGA